MVRPESFDMNQGERDIVSDIANRKSKNRDQLFEKRGGDWNRYTTRGGGLRVYICVSWWLPRKAASGLKRDDMGKT